MQISAQNPAVDGQFTSEVASQSAPVDSALELELTELVIQSLNLEFTVAEVDPAGPIYGDGLGLDSIDILEIALVVSKKYGFQLRSDDERNVQIFSSLRSLARHVAANRTK
ncbi:MAG: phosphopantetheine-binding protein [Aquabacterium sp.]|uniref:phosphopantetheine-binding protein n=1 Tax=Aquabacterium sp. TaxID=1872578 RepID=UPI0027177629|nr:phosphopantetheine-binding protein [Aquabacterium sp.]MDO9006260.1 phosphopantetheine-binding protein [Aquabacterium sp.]